MWYSSLVWCKARQRGNIQYVFLGAINANFNTELKDVQKMHVVQLLWLIYCNQLQEHGASEAKNAPCLIHLDASAVLQHLSNANNICSKAGKDLLEMEMVYCFMSPWLKLSINDTNGRTTPIQLPIGTNWTNVNTRWPAHYKALLWCTIDHVCWIQNKAISFCFYDAIFSK